MGTYTTLHAHTEANQIKYESKHDIEDILVRVKLRYANTLDIRHGQRKKVERTCKILWRQNMVMRKYISPRGSSKKNNPIIYNTILS